MIDLKSYFHDKYQGGENFIENVILPIFGEDKYEDAYEEDVLENNPELTHMADTIGISQILRLGTINIPMNPTDVFDITVSNHVQMERNRVTIQQLVRRIMSTFSSAFIVFHYDDNERWDWRFTFCSKQGSNQESTDSKRYTFLLGPNQSCRTAAENFKKLASKHGEIELEDIVKAFDVESLSKEFFEKYKVRYGRFVGHVIGKEYVDKGDGKGEWRDKEGLTPSELFYGLHEDEKVVRDYVKKLLGRIVFLHFLQKKGWLGATDEGWTNGPQDFMHQLFESASTDQQENFLDEILEPLFTCLDTPLRERREVFDTKVDGLRSVRVPFLGGLFERTEEDKALSIFPRELFADLFKFLSEYNFTIDENDPNDAQVGVDPEMLGRIFENLLEDNKDKGAFYTPKEIVQYMCRESLIAYLQTDVTDEPTREALRRFVTSHDVAVLGGRSSALALNVSQCLKDVKICDPAIGSGAFPMGLLNELFLCRGVIEDFGNAAAIKRHIIEQNIFGVDIEKGAVEIARLRFWLSLITDADKPDVLPNMDFKIMQGNSLLEQYKGVELSGMSLNEQEKKRSRKKKEQAWQQTLAFDEEASLDNIQNAIREYYSTDDHRRKTELRNIINSNVKSYILNLKGCTPDIQRKLENLPIPNDQFFLWHIYFKEVFDKGGFDIVIGNPPYIKEYENRKAFDGFREYSPYYIGKMDLWYGFACHGIDMTKPNGILSFIAQNNWTTSAGAKKMRKKIAKDASIIQLLDFNDYMVFDEASIQTMVMFFRHSSCLEEYNFENYGLLDNATKKDFLALLDKGISEKTYYKLSVFKRKEIEDKTFVFPEESNLINKLKKDKTFLKPKEVGQGIVPALDDYFLVDNPYEYTSEEQKYIVPFYTGVLDRYSKYPVQNYLIYMSAKNFFGTTLEGFPNLQSHFAPYKDELMEAKTKYGTPNKPYFFVHRERDENFFKPGNEKIVTQVRCEYPKFFYTKDSFYGSRALFFIRSSRFDMKFLTGVLNSRIVEYWLRNNGKKQGKLLKLDKEPLLSIPLPLETCNQLPIITLVDRILAAKEANPLADTTAEEREIDRLVYELYGLTNGEVKIIDPNETTVGSDKELFKA